MKVSSYLKIPDRFKIPPLALQTGIACLLP